MKATIFLTLLALLAGCTVLATQEHAWILQMALADDQTCQSQGWHYPDPRYVTCRMELDDKRQYRDWKSLQLMRQSQYPNPSQPLPYAQREIYRPLDRDHYNCRYLTENGADYILCGEEPQN